MTDKQGAQTLIEVGGLDHGCHLGGDFVETLAEGLNGEDFNHEGFSARAIMAANLMVADTKRLRYLVAGRRF